MKPAALLSVLVLVACGGNTAQPAAPLVGPLVPAAEFRILSPSDDGAANEASPLVRWTGVVGARSYAVTVSDAGPLAGVLDFRIVSGNSVRIGPFADRQAVRVEVTVIGVGGDTLAEGSSRFRVVVVPASIPPTEVAVDDATRTQGGYKLCNLFTVGIDQQRLLVLLNAAGEVVWFHVHPPVVGNITDARALPGGTLLFITHPIPLDGLPWSGRAVEMTWDGQVVWESRDGVFPHHEVAPGPDGHLMYLTYVAQDVDGVDYEGDGIEIVDRTTGAVVWDWNIFDHYSPRDIITRDTQGLSGLGIDWSHSNAVVWDEARSLLWVSIRHFDRIIGVDYPSGEVRVTLGQDGLGGDGAVSHAHAPEVQADGQILFFDNGNSRTPPQSRVVVVDFDEQAGTYEETFVWAGDEPFYDFAVGDADRQPNGNILATSGTHARLLEVAPDGAVVWDFRFVAEGTWIYRAEQVPTELIPPGILPFDDR